MLRALSRASWAQNVSPMIHQTQNMSPMIHQTHPLSTSTALCNCPTHRRTVEMRARRKLGTQDNRTGPKMNRRIRVDNVTGEYFELGKVAPETYKKVMDETRKIQKRMSDSFGTGQPLDQEVLVLYEGEGQSNLAGNQKIIEMERPRPAFFAANLLQRSHGEREQSETVRPSGLG